MREYIFRMFDNEEKLFMNGSRIIESRVSDLNKQGRWTYILWTGLNDSNGNEIFEYDIIQDHIGIGFVEFKNSAYRVNYGNGKYKWFIDYLKSERETIEVVGNVFENPELLNR